jgi:hypothetical protein
MADHEDLFPEEVDFARTAEQARWLNGLYKVNPERWERLRREVRFDDVVKELHGTNAATISCPFHGRDSRPSFHIYLRTNDAYCFGCPEGEKYYDHISFTKKILDLESNTQALEWLEKEFELPPIDDVLREQEEDEEEDEEEETTTPSGVLLSFADLFEPFLDIAATRLAANPDPELAQHHAEVLFEAWPIRDQEGNTEEKAQPLLQMARAMGELAINRVWARKAMRS